MTNCNFAIVLFVMVGLYERDSQFMNRKNSICVEPEDGKGSWEMEQNVKIQCPLHLKWKCYLHSKFRFYSSLLLQIYQINSNDILPGPRFVVIRWYYKTQLAIHSTIHTEISIWDILSIWLTLIRCIDRFLWWNE